VPFPPAGPEVGGLGAASDERFLRLLYPPPTQTLIRLPVSRECVRRPGPPEHSYSPTNRAGGPAAPPTNSGGDERKDPVLIGTRAKVACPPSFEPPSYARRARGGGPDTDAVFSVLQNFMSRESDHPLLLSDRVTLRIFSTKQERPGHFKQTHRQCILRNEVGVTNDCSSRTGTRVPGNCTCPKQAPSLDFFEGCELDQARTLFIPSAPPFQPSRC